MSTLAAPAVPLRHDAPTIGLVSVAHGLSHFCQLIVPPLFPWIAPAFGLSYTELGLLMTVFFVVSCIGQALAGFVVDHYGARRVLYAGMACLALAALGLASSPNYATMMAFMALAGIGNCVFHPVDFSILNGRVSQPRLGHAYAAHGISGNLGWAFAPVFVVGIAQLSSWRGSRWSCWRSSGGARRSTPTRARSTVSPRCVPHQRATTARSVSFVCRRCGSASCSSSPSRSR